MKISVAMTSHNSEKYIARQIESILSQLGPGDELCISDDSSTDGTIAIIGSFHDLRIQLSMNNTFYNPIFNLENAIKMVTGDIIILADSDDVWLPGRIEMIRRELKLPGIKLIVMNGYVCDKDLVPQSKDIFQQLHSGPGLLKNFYRNTYIGCCMAFTRKLLDVALPFPKRVPMHDVWLGLLAQMYGLVTFIMVPTLLYRRHGGTQTQLIGKINYWRAIRNRWNLITALIGRILAYGVLNCYLNSRSEWE